MESESCECEGTKNDGKNVFILYAEMLNEKEGRNCITIYC